MSQPIEYRQLYARMFAVRVRHGKHYTERAAEALQGSDYQGAMSNLEIAQSFFPGNPKLDQLVHLVGVKMKKATDKTATTQVISRPKVERNN